MGLEDPVTEFGKQSPNTILQARGLAASPTNTARDGNEEEGINNSPSTVVATSFNVRSSERPSEQETVQAEVREDQKTHEEAKTKAAKRSRDEAKTPEDNVSVQSQNEIDDQVPVKRPQTPPVEYIAIDDSEKKEEEKSSLEPKSKYHYLDDDEDDDEDDGDDGKDDDWNPKKGTCSFSRKKANQHALANHQNNSSRGGGSGVCRNTTRRSISVSNQKKAKKNEQQPPPYEKFDAEILGMEFLTEEGKRGMGLRLGWPNLPDEPPELMPIENALPNMVNSIREWHFKRGLESQQIRDGRQLLQVPGRFVPPLVEQQKEEERALRADFQSRLFRKGALKLELTKVLGVLAGGPHDRNNSQLRKHLFDLMDHYEKTGLPFSPLPSPDYQTGPKVFVEWDDWSVSMVDVHQWGVAHPDGLQTELIGLLLKQHSQYLPANFPGLCRGLSPEELQGGRGLTEVLLPLLRAIIGQAEEILLEEDGQKAVTTTAWTKCSKLKIPGDYTLYLPPGEHRLPEHYVPLLTEEVLRERPFWVCKSCNAFFYASNLALLGHLTGADFHEGECLYPDPGSDEAMQEMEERYGPVRHPVRSKEVEARMLAQWDRAVAAGEQEARRNALRRKEIESTYKRYWMKRIMVNREMTATAAAVQELNFENH